MANGTKQGLNVEAKDEVEMQTSVDDSSIFTEVSRIAKASTKPRWSPSQGPSSRLGNSMDSLGPFPHVSGYPMSLLASISWTAPQRLYYQASRQNVASLVPFGIWWRPHHTTNTNGVVSQDYKPHRVQIWCAQAPLIKRYANLTSN
jgi:hypothetical protein